jgi:hypothetical protein
MERQPDFSAAVDELCRFVRQQPDALPWTNVEVIEVRLGSSAIADHPRFSITEFTERWPILLSRVDRDWVNLSAYGVQDGQLVVAVEWFPRADGEPVGQKDVTVNLSGAAAEFIWPW